MITYQFANDYLILIKEVIKDKKTTVGSIYTCNEEVYLDYRYLVYQHSIKKITFSDANKGFPLLRIAFAGFLLG
jgi:hypothetical protein